MLSGVAKIKVALQGGNKEVISSVFHDAESWRIKVEINKVNRVICRARYE